MTPENEAMLMPLVGCFMLMLLAGIGLIALLYGTIRFICAFCESGWFIPPKSQLHLYSPEEPICRQAGGAIESRR